MFTGLIERVGNVVAAENQPYGKRIIVDPGDWDYHPEPGASIAVNGCCLTYAPAESDERDQLLRFDVVQQTLDRTSLGQLQIGSRVNLEGCLTPSSRLGGHFVQGHIDATGTVQTIDTTHGHRVTIAPPPSLMPYIVPTGSIALDGVSLTVADVNVPLANFTVALIPTTLAMTTFDDLRENQPINIEVDLLVKSVVHYMQHYAPPTS
ncbi:MAG: riboflavin synthase [Phycisphaeraceae bacterium]